LTEDRLVARAARERFPDADVRSGQPIDLLATTDVAFDIVATVLPFGRAHVKAAVTGASDTSINVVDELGHLILVRAAQRLTERGIGVFVVLADMSMLRALEDYPRSAMQNR